MSDDDWTRCPVCSGDALKTVLDACVAEYHAEGAAPIAAILTDLIAELRGLVADSDDEWSRVMVSDAADDAEERLKGLNDE
jgi:hypothetical protein